MSFPPRPKTIPLGSESGCAGANEKVHEIIRLAETAWYSPSPMTKMHHTVEYRRHPEHDRYFHIKQYVRCGVHIEFNELNHDCTITEIIIHPCPSQWNGNNRKHFKFVQLRDALTYTNKSDHTLYFGEHFVTECEGTNRYYHRCFDGSVKALCDPLDPFRPGVHPGVVKLEIFLSFESTAYKNDIIRTLSRALQASVGHPERAARHAAFWYLKEIIKQRRNDLWNLNPLIARVAGRSADNTWYQYVANSSRLFRETEGGGLEEYHRDTKLVSPIVDPGVEVQASLSRRKARMYGFAAGFASNVLEDRF